MTLSACGSLQHYIAQLGHYRARVGARLGFEKQIYSAEEAAEAATDAETRNQQGMPWTMAVVYLSVCDTVQISQRHLPCYQVEKA